MNLFQLFAEKIRLEKVWKKAVTSDEELGGGSPLENIIENIMSVEFYIQQIDPTYVREWN